ncbi:CACTA en-spm transposon protein [Cucumis melo var. makuwa]|uniref:CACTA en-spm transposon protein n=1 Tax=Cucumis melo var. makuwa TaxID=1194695 RepID=A0A5D3DFK0_CUCMM|nr:CACTA en-spm transposon protein [Cucumis melo var. makuwa]TYK22372.1 CACTA en-spm transposon protein [Cucumis melo var. makuwa]
MPFWGFPDAARCCDTALGNPLYNRFSSVKYRTEIERGKERRSSKPRGEKRGDRSVSAAAVPPPSATLDNIVGGSSSVSDNTGSSSQQATPTPRRHAQSRLLELERHVAINGRIPMTIALGAEKPIFPHTVRFSQAIAVCVRKTFSVRCLKFVEHQMLTTFKEFRVGCHRHFKKYSDLEEALPTHQTHWLDVMRIDTSSATTISAVHFRSNHGRTRLLDRSSLTIIVEGPSHFYNDSTSSLREKRSRSINQILELQSQPTPEGSQPVSEDEICDQVLSRRPGYSKGPGWGPKPKARRTASASSSSISCLQSTEKEIELQAKILEALERIEVQDRNHQALASQVESIKKMIEELARAQQGPPYDP